VLPAEQTTISTMITMSSTVETTITLEGTAGSPGKVKKEKSSKWTNFGNKSLKLMRSPKLMKSKKSKSPNKENENEMQNSLESSTVNNNDEMMDTLFGNLNTNFQRKLDWWSELIVDSSVKLNDPLFSINGLKMRFKRKGLTPIGLGKVINELVNNKVIMKREVYWSLLNDFTWKNWIYNKVTSYSPFRKKDPLVDEQEYIILPIIENEAKKIISEINEKYLFKTERILFIEDLEKDFPNISLLIPYLYSTNIAVSWEWKGRQVIKFRSESETKVQYSEIDNGIISLKTTQSILQLQIDRISEGILNYKKLATKAGKDGNKPLAYSYIRRKKTIRRYIK